MPTQLPDHLVVAHLFRVEEVDIAPVTVWCPHAGDWLQLPIDRFSERKVAMSEQVEAAA